MVPQDGDGAGDGAADQWKTLTDYSGNAQMKPEIVARLARPVYTDAVRITVLNENPVAINELYLYQADAGASLESYLSSVETVLGKLTVGEYAGNVTRAAKTKLEVVLERARAALDAGLTRARPAGGRRPSKTRCPSSTAPATCRSTATRCMWRSMTPRR